MTIFTAKGCSQCTNGYKGRVGIYQVMPCTETIGRIIMEGGNSMQIAAQAKAEGVGRPAPIGPQESQGRPYQSGRDQPGYS